MLGLALIAALALGPRPAELVKPGEEANYATWLEGQAKTAAGFYAHRDCATATVKPVSSGVTTDEQLSKRRPGALVYAERFAVAGCGEADAQGLVVIRETRWWLALPTAPGDSVASLSLQREVLPTVIRAVKDAAEADTSCTALDKARSALVYNTRVTKPAALGQPWSERWFMGVCDTGYTVDIDFTPQGGRTTYQVRVAAR